LGHFADDIGAGIVACGPTEMLVSNDISNTQYKYGEESKWEKLVTTVSGNSGKNKNLPVGGFILLLIECVAKVRKESLTDQLDEFMTH
jgi:hypothetical protein